MAARIDKFSDLARIALTLAQDEASRGAVPIIGPEHILLAITRLPGCVGAQVLEAMSAPLPDIRLAVEAAMPREERRAAGLVGLTDPAKRVIELAIDEAHRLGGGDLTTGHLLLGCLGEGEGIAARVLTSFGIGLGEVRKRVRHASPEEAATAAAAPAFRTQSLPPDEVERMRAQAARFGAVTPSSLRSVIAIGQVRSDEHLTLELRALEVRELGGVLHWRAHAAGQRRGPPEFRVGDDAGTSYEIGGGGSMGSNGEQLGELLFVPAPPQRASMMWVEVPRFHAVLGPPRGGGPQATEHALVPAWRFEVRVRDSG